LGLEKINKINTNNNQTENLKQKKASPLGRLGGASFKLKQKKGEILWYRKDDYTFRRYDYALDYGFVTEYLTHGTSEEIAQRKKLFSKFPASIENGKPKVENIEVTQPSPVKPTKNKGKKK